MSMEKLFATLAEKPPHPLDPWLNAIQRRAYTTENKDGILSRTLAVDPDFLKKGPPQ